MTTDYDRCREVIENLLTRSIGLDAEDKPGVVSFLTEVEVLSGTLTANDSNTEIMEACAAVQSAVEELIFSTSENSKKILEAISNCLNVLLRRYKGETVELPGSSSPTGTWLSLQSLIDPVMIREFATSGDSSMDELEACLLLLEQHEDKEQLTRVRRIIHTLKGEAGVLGFPDLEVLCHEVENYIDKKDTILSWEFFFHLVDHLRNFFSSVLEEKKTDLDQPLQELMLIMKKPEKEELIAESLPVLKPRPGLTARLKQDEFLIREFVSNAMEHLENADQMLLALEKNATDKGALDSLFRSFHTVKGMASFLELDDITVLAHEVENLFEKAREGLIQTSGYTVDLLFLCNDTLKSMVQNFHAAIEADIDPTINEGVLGLIQSLRKAYRQSGTTSSASLAPPASGSPESDAKVVSETPVPDRGSATVVTLPPASGTSDDSPLSDQKMTDTGSTVSKILDVVKVESSTLDNLIDFIGELVIVESMIARDPEITALASQRILRNMAQFGKITRELQEVSLAMRTMPLTSTFQKMARLVRDLSRKQKKKIDFVMTGDDTELDRLLVEKIGDPLIHMVRNAVDHGIEPDTSSRIKAGKPPVARIKLAAFHKGGNIVIEMTDDGRGIKRETILAKARAQNLITADAVLSDREILHLIFHAGFSTAAQVSDVSGRGVGMDVVKRNIEELRGRIEIESEEGQGTRFSLVLPLTLAIIDGMTVTAGNERYIIPILAVMESVNASDLKIESVVGQGQILRLRNKIIPYVRLRDIFRIDAPESELAGIVIIVQDMGEAVALHVDQLLGQQQIVIKSLGEFLQKVPGVSGGAIMPDGSVGLILDVPSVVRHIRGR